MSERITDNVNPTDDDVREWGYDVECYFMEQDEDLLLYDVSYVPVLLELAQDVDCPKKSYALAILGEFVRCNALVRYDPLWQHIEKIVTPLIPTNDGLQQWRDYVLRLLSYRETPFVVRGSKDDEMADDILLGIGRVGNIVRAPSGDSNVSCYRLTTSFTEDLRINRRTGECAYLRSYHA